MWADDDFSRRVTRRLHVGMVDEWLNESERGVKWNHKSWYLALTQRDDLLKKLGGVRGLPKHERALLLFEDDVVALVQYLFDSGLIDFDDDGRVVNVMAVEDAKRKPIKPLSKAEIAKYAKQMGLRT